MKRMLTLFLVLTMVFTLIGCKASSPKIDTKIEATDKNYTLKLSHIFSEGHPQTIAIEHFAKLVNEYSEGTIEIDIYPNSMLGGEEQSVEGFKSGTLDMAVIGTLMQNEVPNLGIIQLPFLFKNYEQAEKIMRGDLAWDIISGLESFNIKPLAVTTQGFRQIISNKPLESMDDLKGFRLRTANYKNMIDMGEALGCAVNAMGLSEVFPALQTKVIDGLENSYMALRSGGYHEVLNYILESNHVFTPNIISINLSLFNEMSEDQQEAVKKAAIETADFQWNLAKDQDLEDKKAIEESGINIIYPTNEFHDQMVAATGSVYEDLYKKAPEARDIVNKIREVK